MLFVFFAIGVLIGGFGKKSGTYIYLISIWILLNFGAFWIINSSVEHFLPDKIQNYQTMLNKYTKIMEFEKRCEIKSSKKNEDNIQNDRILIESYLSNEFRQIENMEKKLFLLITKNIETYNRWCLLTPTTLFRITVNEASGSGYINYLGSYNYVLNMQRKFINYWFDRVYYHDPKVMVNFIQGDEDIFIGKSYTPPFFILGLLINLSYGLILFFIGYFCFKHMLFPKTKEPIAFDNIKIELNRNDDFTFFSKKESFNDQLFRTFFSHSKGIVSKIVIGNNANLNNKKNYIYLPNSKKFPTELKGKHLIFLFKALINNNQKNILKEELGEKVLKKRFKKLDLDNIAKIILTLALKINAGIYIFDEFVHGITDDMRVELAQRVKIEYDKRQTNKNT